MTARTRLRRDVEVAGMGIGVEEAMAEVLIEHGAGKLLSNLPRIDACGANGGSIADLDRGHVLKSENAAR